VKSQAVKCSFGGYQLTYIHFGILLRHRLYSSLRSLSCVLCFSPLCKLPPTALDDMRILTQSSLLDNPVKFGKQRAVSSYVPEQSAGHQRGGPSADSMFSQHASSHGSIAADPPVRTPKNIKRPRTFGRFLDIFCCSIQERRKMWGGNNVSAYFMLKADAIMSSN
jgi:hypothetical protein